MPVLTKRQERILNLAEKGEISLLDELEKMEETMESHISEMKEMMKETREMVNTFAGVERLKGDKGDKPTDEDLLALIKPLIPVVEDGKTPTAEELLALIRPLIPKVKDGETPSDDRLITLITPLIPPPSQNGKDADEEAIVKKIEADLPKLGEPVRDSLELLQGENRLDKKAVKGIEELEKKIEEVASRPTRNITGMKKIPIVKRVNLTSQVDGSTRTFTLPRDTVAILGLFGTQFPITFDEADWTFAGNTITLATPIGTPQSGQTLFALVETLFY